MVISAFPFLNELDLLEFRLRTMSPMVDLFVLIESPMTFSGKEKPLYFNENKERFAQWPIHHIIVPRSDHASPWDREDYQRKTLVYEVECLNPDIAIFSDCDEVVAPDVVERFRASGHERMRLELDMLKFFIDRKDRASWIQGCIMRWQKGMQPEWRGGEAPVLPNAGWHFEYVGSRANLLEKVDATSHAPEEGSREFRRQIVQGQWPELERTVPYPVEKLPVPMQQAFKELKAKGWATQRSAFTIVFNGDFTLEQCVENAMPVLDRYVIVEGCTTALRHISNNGASTDRTLEIIARLKDQHGDKLVVVSSIGCPWLDKTVMCNMVMPYLVAGLVWQLDCDEFYHQDAMVRMMDCMDRNPQYTEAEFWAYHFFGGFTCHTLLKEDVWGNNPPWRRLFRWNGERWLSHAPPRLDRKDEHVLDRDVTRILGSLKTILYHYGYCWHRQVLEKALYHNNRFQWDMLDGFYRAARTGPVGLTKFVGEHPVDVSKFAQH